MNTQVVLVGLYRYLNIPTRILHPTIDQLDGVNVHTIFYKNYDANIFSLPSPKEEEIFVDTIKQLKPKIVGISVLSPYVEIAKRLTHLIKKNSDSPLKAILLTNVHHDRTSQKVKEVFKVPVYIHKRDASELGFQADHTF